MSQKIRREQHTTFAIRDSGFCILNLYKCIFRPFGADSRRIFGPGFVAHETRNCANTRIASRFDRHTHTHTVYLFNAQIHTEPTRKIVIPCIHSTGTVSVTSGVINSASSGCLLYAHSPAACMLWYDYAFVYVRFVFVCMFWNHGRYRRALRTSGSYFSTWATSVARVACRTSNNLSLLSVIHLLRLMIAIIVAHALAQPAICFEHQRQIDTIYTNMRISARDNGGRLTIDLLTHNATRTRAASGCCCCTRQHAKLPG